MNSTTKALAAAAVGVVLVSGAVAARHPAHARSRPPQETQAPATPFFAPIDPDTVLEPAPVFGADRGSVFDGIYTEAQATRGAALYQESCEQCHLTDLMGDGVAPPLAGAMFHFQYDEQPLAKLFTGMRDTMPQEAPASLGAQAYADIMAFILEANEFPPGDDELGFDTDDLEKIFVDEVPP